MNDSSAHFSIMEDDVEDENYSHHSASPKVAVLLPFRAPSSVSSSSYSSTSSVGDDAVKQFEISSSSPPLWPSDEEIRSNMITSSFSTFSSSTTSSSTVTFHQQARSLADSPTLTHRLSAFTASVVAAARNSTSQVAKSASRLGVLAKTHLSATNTAAAPLSPSAEFDLLPDLESVDPVRSPLTKRRVQIHVDVLTYVFSFHCTTVSELVCKEWLEVARGARLVLQDLPKDLKAHIVLTILRRYSSLQLVKFAGVQCVTDSFVREAIPIFERHWGNNKERPVQTVLDFSDCPRLTDVSRELFENLTVKHQGLTVLTHGCYMMAVLTPRVSGVEMIRWQVLALRHPWDPVAGMAKAFTYASPANREATGPLSRFSRMINQGYGVMTSANRAFVYPNVVSMSPNEEPHTWVVRFDKGNETQTFLWTLTVQDADEEENPGCFMTSSVYPLRATGAMLDQKPWVDAKTPVYDYTNLRLLKTSSSRA